MCKIIIFLCILYIMDFFLTFKKVLYCNLKRNLIDITLMFSIYVFSSTHLFFLFLYISSLNNLIFPSDRIFSMLCLSCCLVSNLYIVYAVHKCCEMTLSSRSLQSASVLLWIDESARFFIIYCTEL